MSRRFTRVAFVIPTTPASELTPNNRYRRGGIAPARGASAMLKQRAHQVFSTETERAGFATPLFHGAVEVNVLIGWERYLAIGDSQNAAGEYSQGRWQYRQRPDGDGAIGMLKPLYDALQSAGIITNDRMIKRYGIDQENDPAGDGFIAVEIVAIDGVDVDVCADCGGARVPARAGHDLIGLYCHRCRRLTPANVRLN